MEDNEIKETYIGETDTDGNPCGRGTIDFGDGRKYSGEIEWSEQKGRGVYRYSDGSRLECGFTIDREHPAWRFTDCDGAAISGIVSRFPAEDADIEAGRFNEVDTVYGHISQAAESLGLEIEYNARTLLADAILRRGISPDDEKSIREVVEACAVFSQGMILSNTVIRYIYRS